VRIAANVDASFLDSVEGIQQALYDQTFSPVLWSDGVSAMTGEGVGTFVEFGPGSVLSGLIKRIAKGVNTAAVGKTSDIEKAMAVLGGEA
jgi:[acyl-carrier-protein] S-malonyltransferase